MEEKPKWVEIYDALQKRLRDGEFPQGVALPSEESIVRRYKVSRITAVKAMDELRRNGLVYRRRGSGTFATKFARREAGQLGMIFPSLAVGEIFPRICQTLVRLAQKDGYSFVLGDISSPDPSQRAREACDVARMFVKQKIAGVVLQPLAFLRTPERVTKEIMHMLDDADIPLVLVDRDLTDGETMRYDFVGIDNVAAGRALGAHLAGRSAKRIAFLMRPNCASVIRERLDGVSSAAADFGRVVARIVAEPSDAKSLGHHFLQTRTRPDAVVCESDYVAAQLINTLAKFRLSVPRDVMVAGFDDMHIARSATPQLTTIHQPCEDIALVAYRTLRERLQDLSLPARKMLLHAPLVVRDSTVLGRSKPLARS